MRSFTFLLKRTQSTTPIHSLVSLLGEKIAEWHFVRKTYEIKSKKRTENSVRFLIKKAVHLALTSLAEALTQ